MNLEKGSRPLAFIAIAIIFLAVGFAVGQKTTGLQFAGINGRDNSSSNILFITNPVTSFNGRVDKIEGNSVFVSQQITLNQPFAGGPATAEAGKGVPSPFPTPISKVLSFKVNLTPNTQISRPSAFIPYIARLVTPAPPSKLSVQDIKVGQLISISTNTDLRTIATDTFEATSIQLPGVQNNLQGTISRISGNIIIMKAISSQPPAMGTTPQPPKELEYTVTTTSTTEISRYKQMAPPNPGEVLTPPTTQTSQIEEFKLEDLKVGMQIIVFAAEDVVSTQKLTAMRIEPIFTPPMPTLAPPVPTLAPIESTKIILSPSTAATSPAQTSL